MDFDRLLKPLSADAPSGIELRNDPRFHAIERALEPAARAHRVNEDGSLNESDVNVAWQDVLDDALELASAGRDLRLLVIIVRAAARLDGFEGLTGGLDVLCETLERFWDDLHPGLRANDDPKLAALPRSNALKQLENDDNGLLGDLKYSIVLSPRGLGPVSGIDLASASLSEFEFLNRMAAGLGKAEKDDLAARQARRVNRVNAACRALAAEEPERAAAMIAAILGAEASVGALCAKLSEKGNFGSDPGLSLPELTEFLGMVRATLEAAVATIGKGKTGSAETAADASPRQDDAARPAKNQADLNGPAGATGSPGVVSSRKDVEASLDRIIEFYERTEPSSPIPHLARRMRRMVPMDFVELMEEIAPSGMKEFRSIAGVDETKKK